MAKMENLLRRARARAFIHRVASVLTESGDSIVARRRAECIINDPFVPASLALQIPFAERSHARARIRTRVRAANRETGERNSEGGRGEEGGREGERERKEGRGGMTNRFADTVNPMRATTRCESFRNR